MKSAGKGIQIKVCDTGTNTYFIKGTVMELKLDRYNYRLRSLKALNEVTPSDRLFYVHNPFLSFQSPLRYLSHPFPSTIERTMSHFWIDMF